MLQDNRPIIASAPYKTAAELGIPEPWYQALVKLPALIQSGREYVNMRAAHSCIGGYISRECNLRVDKVLAYTSDSRDSEFHKLLYPRNWTGPYAIPPNDPSIVVAIETYLRTGKAEWPSS